MAKISPSRLLDDDDDDDDDAMNVCISIEVMDGIATDVAFTKSIVSIQYFKSAMFSW